MKKGFTLVELLAVIVILAIILVIAIPGISNVIESSRRGAAESNTKMVLKTVEYKMLEDDTFNPTDVNETNVKALLNIDDSNYERLTVKKMNDKIYVTIAGKNKWKNLTISGTKANTRLDDTVVSFVRGANTPVLAEGMIPVKWHENGEEKYWITTTEDDPEWYEYGMTPETRRWANVIQVTTASRETYLTPGTPVNIENDVLAMWVWIPRYVYRIRTLEGNPSSGWHKSTAGIIDIQFTKGIDDNWNKTGTGSIGAIDLDESANASNAETNGNKYTNHPAFTFGDTELTGIWVAKFEASSSTPTAGNGGGDNTSLKVKAIPNVPSWRGMSVNTIFTVTRAMETDEMYGWGNTGNGIDTHMMKNTEWGAVAYLSKSIYGKHDQIWNNPSDSYITGRGGSEVSQGNTPDASGSESSTLYGYDGRSCLTKTEYVCTGAPHATNGLASSTTGNIYGIYDMSGGGNEYTAAYVNNGHTRLNNGSNVLSANAKYKNVYAVGAADTDVSNYALAISSKGDAIWETSNTGTSSTSWYSDNSSMSRTDNPWFLRGGSHQNITYAGTFYFDRYIGGGGYVRVGFRPVLIVESGV